MKLYGTITSERATKGQGGNEYIAINLKDEAQNTFVEVRAIPDGTSARVSVWVKDKLQTTYYNVQTETKGKKEKGEKAEAHEQDCPANWGQPCAEWCRAE